MELQTSFVCFGSQTVSRIHGSCFTNAIATIWSEKSACNTVVRVSDEYEETIVYFSRDAFSLTNFFVVSGAVE
jgi:hypothetical protein